MWICIRIHLNDGILLLLDCKWVGNSVAALIQYGTTNNINKQIHISGQISFI
jgi:hypothetical protein